jgi:divalent metal cation (Fe/Co/Zn/Cd) transporter
MTTTTGHQVHASLAPAEAHRLGRRAQLLACASVTYNVIEAAIAITVGLVAGSVALVGFGLDSIVEVSSGLIILWQFRHAMPQTRERQALRLMALSFWALAVYVSFESARALVTGHDPESSPVGIGLAIASLLVMPFLSWAQRRTGRQLGSAAVVADSTQTLLCTYLSAVLLAGLVLNATLGWSWADPIAGLVIAAVAVREGLEAWRGEACGCGPVATGSGGHVRCIDGSAGGCADDCCAPSNTTAAQSLALRRAVRNPDGHRAQFWAQPQPRRCRDG